MLARVTAVVTVAIDAMGSGEVIEVDAKWPLRRPLKTVEAAVRVGAKVEGCSRIKDCSENNSVAGCGEDQHCIEARG